MNHGFDFHLAPLAGWCNDPNGVIYWRGRYHVFYQFVADPHRRGKVCWAHASSSDGFAWQHHPLALQPDQPYENAGGCWSGSAVADGERLVLIYTGDADDAAGHVETQCLAISTDGGETFTKHPANPVLAPPATVLRKDFRDPKVWQHDGQWYMVVGAAAADPTALLRTVIPGTPAPESPQPGQVLLYRSNDLVTWQPCGVLLNGLGGCCECPDFFELDGHAVLLTSPYGSPVAVVGAFDWSTLRFTPASLQRLDWGPDFYAPQSTADPDGRWMISWIGNWTYPAPQRELGFSWSMTVPRRLHARDGRITCTIDLPTLRRHAGFVPRGGIRLGSPQSLPDAFELIAPQGLTAGTSLRLSLRSPADPEGRFELTITAAGAFTLNRTRPDAQQSRVTDTYTSNAATSLSGAALHVLVDRWSVEVFAADGAVAFTAAMDLAPGGREVRIKGPDELALFAR